MFLLFRLWDLTQWVVEPVRMEDMTAQQTLLYVDEKSEAGRGGRARERERIVVYCGVLCVCGEW